jgi:hypothetical protein
VDNFTVSINAVIFYDNNDKKIGIFIDGSRPRGKPFSLTVEMHFRVVFV